MSKVKLKEIGVFKNGLNFSADRVAKGCKMIGIPDFGNRYFADLSSLSEIDNTIVPDEYTLKDGDILFVRSNGNKALVGRTMIIKGISERITFSGFCIRFRPNSEIAIPLYLLLLFKSPIFRKRFSKTQQTSINNINQEVLGEIEIDLPAKDEQKKIIDCIFPIIQKIEINNAINDNLQQQLHLLYDYWFTQFDFPDENGKPYRSSGGAMAWNSALKAEIPLGWTVGVLSDCIEKVSTGLNPRDNFKLGNGSIRYITVKNLTTSGVLDFSGCDTIDETARTLIHRRSDISKGDILFASIAPLGRCYLIEQDSTDWEINESVFSVRPNIEMTTAEFLYSYFTSPAFIKGATSSSTGSVFKGIRINTLLDTKVLIPPYRIASAFSSKVRGLFSMLNNNAAEISTLSGIRDWILPMLMNGQAAIID